MADHSEHLGAVAEPPRAQALPGELKPLDWRVDRGPISDDEALGVLRRRRRVELAGQASRGRRAAVPDRLPDQAGPKKPTVFRLPARALARAHARAELEGVPLTAVVEELIVAYADGAPQEPDLVQARLAAQGFGRSRR